MEKSEDSLLSQFDNELLGTSFSWLLYDYELFPPQRSILPEPSGPPERKGRG